jgi:hypothetical protein
MLRISRPACGLALLFLLLQAVPTVLAQSQDLIVDICTTPNKYWNRAVALKGHVVRVTPDPPGTNRGRYTLRDQSDKDIDIATDDLPAQGKVYIIHGVVEQRKTGDNVPIVHETGRVLAQPDTPMTALPGSQASAPAPQPSASAPRAAAPASKGPSKADIEEAVRRELEKAKSTQPVPPPAPAAAAPTPAPAPVETPASSSMMQNPMVIGGIVVVVLVVIALIIVANRNKQPAPAAAEYAPLPTQAPASATATQASSVATQVSSGTATMVASKGTEVFMRLGGELTISEGPDRGRNFVISKPTTLIGRAGQRKNELELTDSTISREQAKVLYNNMDRSFKIINESTTNPTRVNGNTVDTAVLQDGDRIEFGNTVVRFKKT